MECETLLPKLGPLPQISQFDATVNSFKDKCRFNCDLEALLMKEKDYRLDAPLGESEDSLPALIRQGEPGQERITPCHIWRPL